MKLTRYLPIVALLGLSATSMAEDEPPPREQQQQQQQQWDRGTGSQRGEAYRVRSHVIPTLAGIEAADKAVGVLHELSGSYQFSQNDAQDSLSLARQALDMALDRAASLQDTEGLSRNARAELDRATRSLRQARTSLRQMNQQIGERGRRMPMDRAERIREEARSVHEDLSQAEDSIERIARAYDIPTDLEFRD